MKILVTVKRIPDPDESLRFTASGLDYSAAKWVPNTFDEYAVETALRLAEVPGQDRLAEVVVLGICPKEQRQHITQFLAMGADRGIIVDAEEGKLDTRAISKVIAEVARREAAELLILGKLSQDNEGNQVGQRVAALLERPQACFAAAVEWDRGQNSLTVHREVDDGVEIKRVPLPAVVTVDLRVVLPHGVKNGVTPREHAYQEGPRLASLRGITMAKRKKVDILGLADLGVAGDPRERILGVSRPPQRKAGQIVASVEDLVTKLATEAKVL